MGKAITGEQHHCPTHEKMVHKTELQWILTSLLIVLSGIIGYVMYDGASKEQVCAVEKAITFKVTSIEKRMDRDREESRENQRDMVKEIKELSIYIRSIKK